MANFSLNRLRYLAVATFSAGAGALILFSNSCSTDRAVVAPLQIEGATYVGDKACIDCHPNISRVFPSSPHARLRIEDSQMPGQNGCESCHGPGSKHIAMAGRGGLEKFIINPGKDPEDCFHCHEPHGMDIMKPAHGLAMARLNENCSTCHREQTRPFIFEHAALREG